VSSSSAARPDPDLDAALVARASAGDRTALDALLRAHQHRVLAICTRMLGEPADAADAAQDAMIAICRGLARFDHRSSFSTWVYRVSTNACLDEIRRRKRRPRAGLPAHEDPRAATAHDDAIAARVTIEAALLELPEHARAAIVLRDLCGLDYAEIGEVLDLPPGTVRSRIARARAALARALGNQTAAGERPSGRP
jgi:RNA polymerase sigma-70 factor (ECF subfamily)